MPSTLTSTAPAVGSDAGFCEMRKMVAAVEKLLEEATDVYAAEVQRIANKHGVQIATGHMSDSWQVKKPRARTWISDWEDDEHPVLLELKELDEIAAEINIGPTNMMMFKPQQNNDLSREGGK